MTISVRTNFRRGVLAFISLVMAAGVPIGVVNAAADTGDCDYAYYRANHIIYNDDCTDVATCGTDGTGTTAVTNLQGENNAEKIFNYLIAKGFTDEQAAGILGNIQAESGFNPTRQEAGQPFTKANSGWGLAQWTGDRRVNPNPALGVVAYIKSLNGDLGKYYAEQYSGATGNAGIPDEKNDALIIAEMDFLFKEISRRTVNPDSVLAGYGKTGQTELSALKNQTSAEAAAKMWVFSFEHPTGQSGQAAIADMTQTANVRTGYAKTILAKYGSAASASSPEAICDDSDAVAAGVTGSGSRQDIVSVAKAELAKWNSGALKPGPGGFTKYLQGANPVNWCAYFASWVYKTAGVPVTGGNGAVATVTELRGIAKAGKGFEYHPVGTYTPKPGDMALYEDHVNIVVAASGPRNYTTIGGNEQGGQPSTNINDTRVYQNPSTTYWPTTQNLDGFLSIKDGGN